MTNFANTALATFAALLLSTTCVVAAVGPAQAAAPAVPAVVAAAR